MGQETVRRFLSRDEITERDKIAEEKLFNIIDEHDGQLDSAYFGERNGLLGPLAEALDVPSNLVHNILLQANIAGRVSITYGPPASAQEVGHRVIKICSIEPEQVNIYESQAS